MARLLDELKAGWNAPPGTWQRKRRRPFVGPPPDWQDVPPPGADEPPFRDAEDVELAKRDAVIKELIGELEQCRGELTAAQAELAAGFSKALRDRFIRVARIVLHPDKYGAHPAVTDVGAFVDARFKEIEVEVDKIGTQG